MTVARRCCRVGLVRRVAYAGTAALLVVLSMTSGAWGASPGVTTRVSGVCPTDALPADLDAVSGDGRFVAVTCNEPNAAGQSTSQVYVHDAVLGRTVLASRASGIDGAMGNAYPYAAAISADGRFVAFSSYATNLAPRTRRGASHVYVRDLRSNTTTLVDRRPKGVLADDPSAADPSLSADGRYVAFAAFIPSSRHEQVLVRDMQTTKTTVVSRATGARGAMGNGDSTLDEVQAREPCSFFVGGTVSISADGRRVAFDSDASNLTRGDHDRVGDVFVRDLRARTTTLVSRASGAHGAKGDNYSDYAQISADGRSVAFASAADNLVRGGSRQYALYVRNLRTRTTTLVSRASGSDGSLPNHYSLLDSISGDGNLVAFDTTATNLSPGDPDHALDIYVRNVAAQTTSLVSRASGPNGAKANASSCQARLTADGHRVFFLSAATNLTADLHGGVFQRDL